MYVHSPSDLGALIRERRRKLGLAQQQLAERVGVSRQWLINVERGKPRAELALVLKTLAALGLRVAVDDGSATPAVGGVPEPPDIDAIVEDARKVRR